jgi:cytochrome c oxidase subunit II
MRAIARSTLFAALVGGCGGHHVQSMLHPASAQAHGIAWIWWFLFWVSAGVLVLTLGLLLLALLRRSKSSEKRPQPGLKFIVLLGVVFPTIVLTAIMLFSMPGHVEHRPAEGADDAALRIRVTGVQWWWDVQYPEEGVRTANEIHLPVGRAAHFELEAADVVHSFWVPNLHGKRDMIPDQTNHLWITPERVGTYRGQCGEYCGAQHAHMAFHVIVLPEEEFERLIEERRQGAREPAAPVQQRGLEVFFGAKCDRCHAIRGTGAEGRVGPDLTHVGSRLSLGAGTLTNNRGNLGGWIANSQALKPGNNMPRFYLPPADLHALLAYLESLR